MTAIDNGARAQMAMQAHRSVRRLADILEGSPIAGQLAAYLAGGIGYGELEGTLAAAATADAVVALLERIEALEGRIEQLEAEKRDV